MNTYPFASPVLLTDDIFVLYGGETGTSSVARRQAAFQIAEEQVSNYLHTLPVITMVTGTFPFPPYGNIRTDYTYVHAIHSVVLLAKNHDSTCTVQETDSCTYVEDSRYGVIEPRKVLNCYGCSGIQFEPWQVRVVYEAGLPTGTYTRPTFLNALVIQAQVALNEIDRNLGGNEGVGNVGIQEFTNQEYREKRIALLRTALGNSAISNYAAKLLEPMRFSRVGVL